MARTEQGVRNHRAAVKRYKQTEKYREYHKAYMREYYTRTARGKTKHGANLKRIYGLTAEDYAALLERQGGTCACCGKHSSQFKRLLCVDHDHETGEIRGLLCNLCNSGIGKLGDSLDGVRRAVRYLESVDANRKKRSGFN